MGFEGVAEAHQLMHENKHLGKISILVGADRRGARASTRRARARSAPRSAPEPIAMAEVNYIDWHIHPFRADRWLRDLGARAAAARWPSAPRAGR